jgi:hypothetical protein
MTYTLPRHAAESELRQALLRVHQLHDERNSDPVLASALARLAEWQSRRLGQTYADLAADPRYADAVAFFQVDLYGPADYTQRDADVARVVPMLVKMLPERVVGTIAHAMELNALSQELDRVLLEWLPLAETRFTVADYCRAYRRAGNVPARQRQIRLIVEIGRALDEYVTKPLIRAALTMMRGPAHFAGFGVLHDFLDRGFDAFHRMGGAQLFLATIERRETALLDTVVAGSNDPFPDPLEDAPGSAPQEPLAR